MQECARSRTLMHALVLALLTAAVALWLEPDFGRWEVLGVEEVQTVWMQTEDGDLELNALLP